MTIVSSGVYIFILQKYELLKGKGEKTGFNWRKRGKMKENVNWEREKGKRGKGEKGKRRKGVVDLELLIVNKKCPSNTIVLYNKNETTV